MKITQTIEKIFDRYLPSPFTLAVLLTFLTFVLALLFTRDDGVSVISYAGTMISEWEKGIWSSGLLVFAYQMMLILLLGHVLVLSKPMEGMISRLTRYAHSSASAALLVSVTTMIVAFFNWGLGLIFGAILARKVGEHCAKRNIPINYPLIGAAGYTGLMVWHGGISGSAPIKINEKGHLTSFFEGNDVLLAQIPDAIYFNETIFSISNLIIFLVVLIAVGAMYYIMGKRTPTTSHRFTEAYVYEEREEDDKLDSSSLIAWMMGAIVMIAWLINYGDAMMRLAITPNLINLFMLGLGLILHGNIKNYTQAVNTAISDVSGILIQFPLYFGIMGLMKSSGLVSIISDGFIQISNVHTLPIFTFFSAALVNIFVPSGGGQWIIQGPIVLEAALELGVPLNKVIMALAYGDQITNMMQPFWALPLLGITKLKAKEILPYTLIIMVLAAIIYVAGLMFLY